MTYGLGIKRMSRIENFISLSQLKNGLKSRQKKFEKKEINDSGKLIIQRSYMKNFIELARSITATPRRVKDKNFDKK